jgi:hypothetical protein
MIPLEALFWCPRKGNGGIAFCSKKVVPALTGASYLSLSCGGRRGVDTQKVVVT